MKKLVISKFLLGLAIFAFPFLGNAAPLTLVKDGKANATIVVQPKAPAPIKAAADDLQHYLAKITGVTLPLSSDGKEVSGITLNVGKTASSKASDFPDASLNPESYAITQRDEAVYFAGNYPSPTAFAVYSFLEDQLGVRWFAPGEDWDYVPIHSGKSDFTVEVENVVSVPGTSPRIWSGHAWTQDWKDWCLRNKAVQSEKVPRRNFQNKMFEVFPASKYGETHPEYYPLIKGQRWMPSSDAIRDWWPCMGNPEVQRVTVEYIRNYFEKHPGHDSFSLGMDDIYRMCGDELCRAMDAHEDDYENHRFSTRFYKFVNIIAKEIKKSHPDKYIGTLIYHIAVQPPEGVPEMEDNVFGYIANGSVAQWYQPGKKEQWIELSRDWHKRVKRLSRYDYYGMGTHVPRVFPHAMDESIKFDKALGFEGMYVEVYTFLPQTAPMIWAFSKLQWEPEKKVDDLLDEFYAKMFPSASAEVKQYFELMEKSWNTDRPGRMGWVHRKIQRQALSISPEAVVEGMQLLEAAQAKAATAIERRRMEVIRGGLKFGSFAVLEYDLAQQLSTLPVTNEKEASVALEKVQKLASLIGERGTYWTEAAKRDDLLGANIRGLSKIRPGRSEAYLQGNFAPLESPAIPGILRVLDWYQSKHAESAPQITKDLLAKLPAGFIKDAVEASQFLAEATNSGAQSLLKNGDFSGKTQETGRYKGTPAGWSAWSRIGLGEFIPTQGRSTDRKGLQIKAPSSNETSTLMQNLSVKSGERYVGTVWVKLDDPGQAEGVALSFRFRNKDGWYEGKDARQRSIAAGTGDWQKMTLAATVPEGATGVSIMLGVSDTGATFDEVLLYQIPE